MEMGLMVEGQHGLDWDRWRRVLRTAERLEFARVFRSDHYFLSADHQQESLDSSLSFAVAAIETERIGFGSLVAPITYRHPVDLARVGAQIQLLSGGRFVLGLGAAWNEAEHRAYGFPFPPVRERFDRLDEAIQVIRLLWRDEPASFEGRYYRLEGADARPKPGGKPPPILIGGMGELRTLRLVARFADEWNT